MSLTRKPNNWLICLLIVLMLMAGFLIGFFVHFEAIPPIQRVKAAGGDFKILRGTTIISSNQTAATITAGVDYNLEPGITASNAFIRITNTRLTGMGSTSGGGNQTLNNFTARIDNPENLLASITFRRMGVTNDNRIDWEIIQYLGPSGGANEIIVRSIGDVSTLGSQADGSLATTIINSSKVAVFITGQATDNTARTAWHATQFTAELMPSGSNWLPRFTRGGVVNTGYVSYAVVEFTGVNWRNVQRKEFQNNAPVWSPLAPENSGVEPIPAALLDASKAFLHIQFRNANIGTQDVWDSGENVELSIGLTDFITRRRTILGNNNKFLVVWVIENTQSGVGAMSVEHIAYYDSDTTGPEEKRYLKNIAAVVDLAQTSIMSESNSSDGNQNNYPRGSANARLSAINEVSWTVSDSGEEERRSFDVVQWPTAPVSGPVTTQLHFRWRDDSTDLNVNAGWLAAEDSNSINQISPNATYRLRIESANIGNSVELAAKVYQLQWGAKNFGSCSDVAVWAGIGDNADEFAMSATAFIEPDGEAINPGLLANSEIYDYSAGQGRDITDSTNLIGPLPAQNYTEIEYSLQATSQAISGSAYCFRLYNVAAGSPLDNYSVYPEATILRNTDFFIQRGSLQISGNSAAIAAGIDYQAPSSLSRSFIRLTNTQTTGAGHNLGGGIQNADDVTVYISNPENLLTNINFVRFGLKNNTQASWEIVEYIGPAGGHNEIIVLGQGATVYGASALAASSSVVANVINHNKLVPFITGQANPDVGRNDYNTGISTAQWNSASNQIDFSRGEAGGDTVLLSWAAVEFIGKNWQIQRAEHTYSIAGNIETESIAPVNDLGRVFLYAQKRVGNGLSSVDEFGHEIWLSDFDKISFLLENTADNPFNQTSVAWIIENKQITGRPMQTTRSNGTQSGGAEPLILNVDIGKTLTDLAIASIFSNNRVSRIGANYPAPIMGAKIISNVQYQFWLSNTGGTVVYRTEIVEWPTAPVYKLSGFYVSNNFNAGASSIFNIIEWDWSRTDSSCDACALKLQIQTAPDAGGSPGSWTGWCGSAEICDGSDYFTNSAGQLIPTLHNGHQWIRYKATFEGNGSDAPILEEVKINYQ